MKNNKYFESDKIRKIRNKIHKKVYNKKLGRTDNFVNEICLFSKLYGFEIIKEFLIFGLKKDD